MKDYQELLTASYLMIQSMDNHHGTSKDDNYDVRNTIIEEMNNSPPEQREQWLRHLLATVEHLFDVNPQVTNHELFTNNPIDSARKYIEFEKEQDDKSLQ
jgi:hypothetical protein